MQLTFRMWVNAAAVMAAAFVFWALAGFAHAREPKLAVLIAAPWPGEVSMSHDLAATSLALQRRGFAADDIVVLDGPQTRESILRFLASVRRRIAPWKTGEVFMAVSGHGSFTGKTVSDARPAILLSTGEPSTGHMLFWDEVFNALAAPAGVRIVLLPDV